MKKIIKWASKQWWLETGNMVLRALLTIMFFIYYSISLINPVSSLSGFYWYLIPAYIIAACILLVIISIISLLVSFAMVYLLNTSLYIITFALHVIDEIIYYIAKNIFKKPKFDFPIAVFPLFVIMFLDEKWENT